MWMKKNPEQNQWTYVWSFLDADNRKKVLCSLWSLMSIITHRSVDSSLSVSFKANPATVKKNQSYFAIAWVKEMTNRQCLSFGMLSQQTSSLTVNLSFMGTAESTTENLSSWVQCALQREITLSWSDFTCRNMRQKVNTRVLGKKRISIESKWLKTFPLSVNLAMINNATVAIRLENLQRKLEGPTMDTERELLTSRRDCITQHVTTNGGTISVASHLIPDD